MTIAPGVECYPTRSTRHHSARAYLVRKGAERTRTAVSDLTHDPKGSGR